MHGQLASEAPRFYLAMTLAGRQWVTPDMSIAAGAAWIAGRSVGAHVLRAVATCRYGARDGAAPAAFMAGPSHDQGHRPDGTRTIC